MDGIRYVLYINYTSNNSVFFVIWLPFRFNLISATLPGGTHKNAHNADFKFIIQLS